MDLGLGIGALDTIFSHIYSTYVYLRLDLYLL